MTDLKITCPRCGQTMTRQNPGEFMFAYHEEDEWGNTERDFYSEDWICPNDHIAIAWYADDPPSEDLSNLIFDGQIDHISRDGNTFFQEFRKLDKGE